MPLSEWLLPLSMAWCRAAKTLTQSCTHSTACLCSGGSRFHTTAAVYFRELEMKYGTTELKVPTVGKPQTDTTAATPLPTMFGELMPALDILPGQSQMAQGTSQQWWSHMRQGLAKPQARNQRFPAMPDAVPDWSPTDIAMPVQPLSFYPCISCLYVITI